MAYNSQNNHGNKWFSGNLAVTLATTITLTITELFEFALNKNNKLNVINLHNAGSTKFDEFSVLAAYIRTGGIANLAAKLCGYTSNCSTGSYGKGLTKRMMGMNIYTIRKVNEEMKSRGIAAPMVQLKGGKMPFFYTVERLLQLYYTDKGGYGATVPEKLKNWKPKKSNLYYRWFK